MNTKKTMYFLLSLAILLIGCKDDTPEVKYTEPKILSFGFYAEDNVGVIAKDYVIDNVTTTSITVNLPAGTDKSALIARFTTNQDDTVKVNNVRQVSGVTANNFTYPVDYVLSQGNLFARYSVTIGKAADYVWTALPAFTTDSVVSAMMRVNPVKKEPYILFKASRPESANQKAAMLRFENGAWVHMGEASDGQIGSYYDLAFNAAGEPYISYADYTAATSQMHTVKKYNGTSWELVGAKGVTTSKASYNGLTFGPNGQLMLFSMIDATGGVLARRELCVSNFDGTAWTTNQTVTGRTSDLVSYFPTARTVKGAVYLAVYNAVTPNTFSVYKYKDGAWTTLIDKWKEATATGMSIRDFDMEVDYAGNVYVALVDNSTDGASLKHKIVKYTAESGVVSTLGNPFTVVSGGLYNFDLAVSPTGVPFLLYRNETQYPVVASFDDETQEWTTPFVLDTEAAGELSIDFTSTGEAYASYVKNRKLFVFKFAEPK